MQVKPVHILTVLVSLFLLCPSIFAQASFVVASGPVTAADIGRAEQAGSISFTVLTGTTVAVPFILTYSCPIVNNDASEIEVSGTGGLAGVESTPIISGNSLIVDVPADGTTGDMILISGVRVAIAGNDVDSVKVVISNASVGGNLIDAWQGNPVVIDAVKGPISVQQGSPLLSWINGEANSSSYVDVSEQYPNAFSDSVGIGGQTTPTQIRITPYPPLPSGAQITFDAMGVANTGATFITLSGEPETIPRADGSTDVVYQFIAAQGSSAAIETFRFNVNLTQIPETAQGVIQFQAAIGPIGTDTTKVPRYVERLVPDTSELSTGSTILVFPFLAAHEATNTGIALTNPEDFLVMATLTAYDSDGKILEGKDITNPVNVMLPPNGQYAKMALEIFGASFNASSAGTIRVSAHSNIKGFYILGDVAGPRLDGSNGEITSSLNLLMPVLFREGLGYYNLLETYNPSASSATVNFDLLDAGGTVLASKSETLPAGGILLKDVRDIFGINLSAFDGGYIKARSDEGFMLRNNFGNSLESNVLPAQFPSTIQKSYVPHFATGGLYSTELDLVNSSSQITAAITLTLLDDSGQQIPVQGNPVGISIAPGAQVSRSFASLFPSLGSNLVTGSFSIEVGPSISPFQISPAIAGAIRYSGSDGSASATLPLVLTPATDCIYSQVAEGGGYYTGIALQNPNDQPTGFTLDVYQKDGSLVGSYQSSLPAHAKIARMISQLVPAAAGQVGGYFRIRSDFPLMSVALFGTQDIRSLSAITPQILQ